MLIFSGRARRKEYWFFHLCNFIILLSLILLIAFAVAIDSRGLGILFICMLSLNSLVTILPSLALAVRRMHDTNHSGWFILVPFYNLILCCIEGNRGNNRYGKDPKERLR